jgi:hypothetical protein
VVATPAPTTQLFGVLKGAVGRQVGDMAAAILAELKSTGSVSGPCAFHFRPPGLGHHISLVDCKVPLTAIKAALLTLTLNHPPHPQSATNATFKQFSAVQFGAVQCAGRAWPQALSACTRELEVQHGLAGPAVTMALMQGDYAYHHYMQVGSWREGLQ